MSRVTRNLRWGAGRGLLMAGLFCAYALLLYAVRGPAPFAHYGVTVGGVMLTYLVGGVAGGTVVGLLRPLSRWRAGAIGVGVLAAAPAYGAILFAMRGPVGRWSATDWLTLAVASALVGSLAGNRLWEREVYPTLPPPDPPPGPPPRRGPFGSWRP